MERRGLVGGVSGCAAAADPASASGGAAAVGAARATDGPGAGGARAGATAVVRTNAAGARGDRPRPATTSAAVTIASAATTARPRGRPPHDVARRPAAGRSGRSLRDAFGRSMGFMVNERPERSRSVVASSSRDAATASGFGATCSSGRSRRPERRVDRVEEALRVGVALVGLQRERAGRDGLQRARALTPKCAGVGRGSRSAHTSSAAWSSPSYTL